MSINTVALFMYHMSTILCFFFHTGESYLVHEQLHLSPGVYRCVCVFSVASQFYLCGGGFVCWKGLVFFLLLEVGLW